ncbi:Ig-like domain-containing protein, partial [Limnoraphis robusta]|uniref:Ig-like domain-containing protein n=1 Tax=Limnoraphis robusta TaxID=1118279 RepID=UPI002B2118FB
AENITNSEIVANSSNISLQPLQGMDEDGEIVGFRITQLPVNGRLFFNGELLDVNEEIPLNQAGNLTLTPDTDFVGNLQFQYTAIDDDGDEDLTPATFSILVVAENIPTNIPPVAESQTIPTVKNTLSQVSLPALNATDEDGIVESFTILELPTGGELLLSGEAVQNNQPISINQASQLTFIPNQDFVGESQFSFIVTDDDGATSNLATVTIPLIANQPPIAESVATQPFFNNQVNVAFPSLIASDSDGEVELFSLTNLPASNQGKLFLDGIEVSNISQVKQLTDSQISSLSFTPNSTFVGNLELGYFAIDNDGESSNIATITFPIITQQVPLDPPNLPPIAEDLSLFDLINDASDITIPTLTATDTDGQVVSFIINSLPSTGQLFLDQTAITTLTQVQQLTLDQASQLTYVPNSGFLGTVTFTYQATDNDNAISNIATITLEIDSTTIPREDDEIDLICGCIPLPILEGIPLPEPPVFPRISFDSIPISLEGTENDDILFGSNESERIVGLGGNDWIFGEAGNDSLEGNLGNDFINGGTGDDLIDGGSGNDVLFGWLGEDTLFGNSGNNTLFGGTNDLFIPDLNGRDWLISGDNDDFLQGNEGNDVISGGNGNDLAFGGKDDDKIYGDLGNDTLFGNLGNDTLIADPGRENILDNTNNADVLYGNQGNDLLQGSLGNDTIYGGKENDFAYGGKDNDLLRGELGNDTLFGDKGNDTLFGDTNDPNQTELEGRDLLWGGIGNDVIFGNSDNDTLMGGEAEDKLYGGKGDDLLFGEVGNDLLFGDLGNDTLCGNDGNDTLFGDIISLEDSSENVDFQDQVYGGRGDDLLFGNGGDDLLCGGEGNDTLYGGRGDDTLVGGDGDDRLFGDIGNDTLYGDLGRDGFILSSNSGTNRIIDFTNGEDYLGLIGGLTFSDLTIETGENQTLIFVETKLIAQLIGVQVNSITAEDFLELE